MEKQGIQEETRNATPQGEGHQRYTRNIPKTPPRKRGLHSNHHQI